MGIAARFDYRVEEGDLHRVLLPHGAGASERIFRYLLKLATSKDRAKALRASEVLSEAFAGWKGQHSQEQITRVLRYVDEGTEN